MIRPTLVFDSRPWHHLLGHRPGALRGLGLLALSSAIVLLGLVAWRMQATQADLARLHDELHKRQADQQARRTAPAAAAPALPAPPPETLRQLDHVTARLNWPWPDLFDALERSTPPHVALISIEPDAQAGPSGQVALVAEARSLGDLLAYAQQLEADPAVAATRFGQHDQRDQQPGQPVRMTLTLTPRPWRP